jgi:uncharacterized protein (DUF305 family)
MKKVIVLAAAGLLLASAAAYAQMQHRGQDMPSQQGGSGMMQGGSGMMQGGSGMMQGGGMQGGMHRGGMMGGMMGMMHGGGMSGMQPRGDNSPSSLAYHGINMKMHEAMNITFTGNADADFVRGMIPHHQGAIDMAKTVIAFGKDPEVKKLAEDFVRVQESEIALMREWLKKNGQ